MRKSKSQSYNITTQHKTHRLSSPHQHFRPLQLAQVLQAFVDVVVGPCYLSIHFRGVHWLCVFVCDHWALAMSFCPSCQVLLHRIKCWSSHGVWQVPHDRNRYIHTVYIYISICLYIYICVRVCASFWLPPLTSSKSSWTEHGEMQSELWLPGNWKH